MSRQSKEFEAESEHYYNFLNRLEGDVVNLQNHKYGALQLVQDREQQINRLFLDQRDTKTRTQEIADYTSKKCNDCEKMTKAMFLATVEICSPGHGQLRGPL